jgi:hypothetical protein
VDLRARGPCLTTKARRPALSYLIDAPGISEAGRDISPEIGVWLALVGGLLWAAGSSLFAKEIEGDDHLDDTSYGHGRAA